MRRADNDSLDIWIQNRFRSIESCPTAGMFASYFLSPQKLGVARNPEFSRLESFCPPSSSGAAPDKSKTNIRFDRARLSRKCGIYPKIVYLWINKARLPANRRGMILVDLAECPAKEIVPRPEIDRRQIQCDSEVAL